MLLTALGLITVTTAGTPAALTTDATIRCNRLTIEPKLGNTGNILIKDGAGNIVKQLPLFKVGTGLVEKFEVEAGQGENGLQLIQYQVDAITNGDGAYAAYWTR